MPPESDNEFSITAAGAEGDTVPVKVNVHERLSVVLKAGLADLYGAPGPDPAGYEIVFNGTVLNLDSTVGEVGLSSGSEIAILPSDVSRGAWTEN